MHVPLIKPDLPAWEEVADPLRAALASGRITNFGQHVQALEERVGAYLGTPVVTVSSGTVGLLLTLKALGVGPGDKVVMPSFTFVATAQAALFAGAEPLFVEVGDDYLLDPADLDAALTAHDDVAAVVPVHTFGQPCDADAIAQVVSAHEARRGRSIPVVYDSAHAFGARVDGAPVGGAGRAEVFSLSVTKTFVCVEGGMVASADAQLLAQLRAMRNYGIASNYDAHYAGLNGKMSELHAIVGLANLERIDSIVATRQETSATYYQLVAERSGFGRVPLRDGVTHTYKDLVVTLPEGLVGKRDALRAFLSERGVETRAYFDPPVHTQTFFAAYASRPLPRTEELTQRMLTLPYFTSISAEEMEYVADALGAAEQALA